MSETALQAHKLTKHFTGITAVDQLDLTVPTGSIFGLLGVNGAGKTTLIRMIMGHLYPTAGRLTVLGAEPRSYSETVRSRIAYVSENMNLPGYMTPEKAIAFNTSVYKQWDARLADNLLDDFSLRGAGSFKTLSKGQKRKDHVPHAQKHGGQSWRRRLIAAARCESLPWPYIDDIHRGRNRHGRPGTRRRRTANRPSGVRLCSGAGRTVHGRIAQLLQEHGDPVIARDCNDVHLGKTPLNILEVEFNKIVKPWDTPPDQPILILKDDDDGDRYSWAKFFYVPHGIFEMHKQWPPDHHRYNHHNDKETLKDFKNSKYWWRFEKDGCVGLTRLLNFGGGSSGFNGRTTIEINPSITFLSAEKHIEALIVRLQADN